MFRILLVLATSIVVDRVVKYGSYVVFWVVFLEEMVLPLYGATDKTCGEGVRMLTQKLLPNDT